MSDQVIPALEKAINELVDQFIGNPWTHRVEHSLHCELYVLLKKEPALQAGINGNGFQTQMIHKEWPEPVSRKGKNRRGNFDLVILNPVSSDADIHKFRYGKLPILAAIEMGLNYEIGHLESDIEKLRFAEIPHRYLIHFAAKHSRNQKAVSEKVKRLVESESQQKPIKIAYVDMESKQKRKLNEGLTSIIS